MTIDPYALFDEWCRANGYADISDSEPMRVDLARLDAAIAAYASAYERHQREAEDRYELAYPQRNSPPHAKR